LLLIFTVIVQINFGKSFYFYSL